MPMPTPSPDEEKDDFIQRCMGDDTMNDDFPDQSQRRAVCERQWEDKDSRAEALPRYEHVIQAVFGEPWAITQAAYNMICEVVRRRVSGIRLSAEEIREGIGAARPRNGGERSGAVAVLPLYGILAQRANLMTKVSGGTSTQLFEEAFVQAMNDPEIGAIVIDVDSPGGSVYGIQELWQTMMSYRGRKPVVAVANSLAASAAYWVASAADEISVTPGGEVGSIGVLTAHEDFSQAQEKTGVRTTLISSGKKKTQGNPFEPLTDEARADIQGKIDTYYQMFINAVARGRAVPVSTVREGYGEGDTVLAREALRQGMVDRIETLDQAIVRMARQSRANNSQASFELLPIGAELTETGSSTSGIDLVNLLPAKARQPAPVNKLLERRRERERLLDKS